MIFIQANCFKSKQSPNPVIVYYSSRGNMFNIFTDKFEYFCWKPTLNKNPLAKNGHSHIRKEQKRCTESETKRDHGKVGKEKSYKKSRQKQSTNGCWVKVSKTKNGIIFRWCRGNGVRLETSFVSMVPYTQSSTFSFQQDTLHYTSFYASL